MLCEINFTFVRAAGNLSAMLTQEEIQNALKAVKYPGYSRDIVSFGIIKEISAANGAVSVVLQLPSTSPEIAQQVKADAERVLKVLPGVNHLHVDVRHPIASAVSLIGVMGSLAVLYLLLGAEFIAAAQVIVYAGAIMVLFVFVIMLLNAGVEARRGNSLVARLLGIPSLAGLLLVLAFFVARMFPRGATASALRFAHRYIPTTTLGGDFFDILQLSDTCCGLLICDVMGHGVRAGLLTALIRGVVEEMGERSTDPAHVLAEINRSLEPILAQTGEPIFATAFFGVIDTAARTLTYTNAGHPPPFVLLPGTAAPARLAPADPEPAAGLVAGFAYTSYTCPFPPGALFVGYTDGVLEAADPAGNIFGDERLRAVLTSNRGRPGDEVLSQLVREVEAYTTRNVFDDDVCLVAVEAAG